MGLAKMESSMRRRCSAAEVVDESFSESVRELKAFGVLVKLP
jgi:hypothetical protein